MTIDGIVGVSGLQANLLLQPWDITFNSAGTLYITDRFNGRLKKLIRGAQNASILSTPVSSFARPTGIAVDNNDNLYVADQTRHTVSYLNSANSSSVSVIAGIPGCIKIIDRHIQLYDHFLFIRRFKWIRIESVKSTSWYRS